MESLVERISFLIFLGAIGSLVLLSTLPKPEVTLSSQDSQTLSPCSISLETLEEKQPVASNTLSEEKWISLLRRHLWRIAYSKNKKTLFDAKAFFKEIPEHFVEPHIQNMLNSKNLTEMTMGAIGVRYFTLKNLIPEILRDLSSVGEDEQDARVPFYLAALEIGDKNQVASTLLPYLDSKIIHHRLIALESLAKLNYSEVVPHLVKRLSHQKQNAEFHTLTQAITQLVTPEQYSTLTALSSEARPELRRTALSMMETVNLAHFVSQYKRALKDPDISVRRQSYFCFLKLRDSSMAPEFLALAQKQQLSREERIFALEVASYCGQNLKSQQLEPFLRATDPLFRFIALTIQANLKEKSAIPSLIALLEIEPSAFIIGQGSDLEEEQTWFFKQVRHVLKAVTKKEVSSAFDWKQWWRSESHFEFPEFSYLENPPTLYEER